MGCSLFMVMCVVAWVFQSSDFRVQRPRGRPHHTPGLRTGPSRGSRAPHVVNIPKRGVLQQLVNLLVKLPILRFSPNIPIVYTTPTLWKSRSASSRSYRYTGTPRFSQSYRSPQANALEMKGGRSADRGCIAQGDGEVQPKARAVLRIQYLEQRCLASQADMV
jgi:hypothetical protein